MVETEIDRGAIDHGSGCADHFRAGPGSLWRAHRRLDRSQLWIRQSIRDRVEDSRVADCSGVRVVGFRFDVSLGSRSEKPKMEVDDTGLCRRGRALAPGVV